MNVLKRVVLVLTGFSPLPIGYLIYHLIGTIWVYRLPVGILNLISFAFLVLWFMMGMISAKFFTSKSEAVLLQNAAAILSIALISFQTLITARVWSSWAGWMFYVPLYPLARGALRIIPTFGRTVVLDYVAFGCLLLASYLGAILFKKLHERRKYA